MRYELYWTPVRCRQVLESSIGTQTVRQWLPLARLDLERLRQAREASLNNWLQLRLSRRELLALNDLRRYLAGEIQYIRAALDRLGEYAEQGRRSLAAEAMACWLQSENCHADYMKERARWESELLARRLREEMCQVTSAPPVGLNRCA